MIYGFNDNKEKVEVVSKDELMELETKIIDEVEERLGKKIMELEKKLQG